MLAMLWETMSPYILKMGVDAAVVQSVRYWVCRHVVHVKYNELTVKHQCRVHRFSLVYKNQMILCCNTTVLASHLQQFILFLRHIYDTNRIHCAWKHHKSSNRPFSQWEVVILQVWGWNRWTALWTLLVVTRLSAVVYREYRLHNVVMTKDVMETVI